MTTSYEPEEELVVELSVVVELLLCLVEMLLEVPIDPPSGRVVVVVVVVVVVLICVQRAASELDRHPITSRRVWGRAKLRIFIYRVLLVEES